MNRSKDVILSAPVPIVMDGGRFDKVAAYLFSEFSRAKLQSWINSGEIRVDNLVKKPKDPVFTGQLLQVSAQLEAQVEWQSEQLPIDIVYEDQDIIVINKSADVVVHPAAGNYTGTLVNGLLYLYPELENVPRAGVIHRLDKDTTGLMVIARNLTAHTWLVEQMQQRLINREYEAVANGVMTGGGTIDKPIGRHPVKRKKMAIIENNSSPSKQAITNYRVLKRFRSHTHIRVKLETGRTHQIRVHFSYKKYPLIGDATYGRKVILPKHASSLLRDYLQQFERQALHAKYLGLYHPTSKQYLDWEINLPTDIINLLQLLTIDLQRQ